MQFIFKIHSVLCLLMFPAIASAQLGIDFSADVLSGCAPMEVAFNLSATEPGYSYSWTFGDGKESSAANPKNVYVNEGAYTVSLTVSYQGDSETITKEGYIVVHNKPVVDFELLSDTIGCAPYVVDFQNNSYDIEGGALEYTWSFGDGNRSSDTNPSHSYVPAGDFDVTLLVRNEYGCFASATKPELVHALRLQASFGVDPFYSCTGSLDVSFTNSSQARRGFLSEWNFGDGHTSLEQSPQHFYEQSGSYTVQLTVTDDIGCKSVVTRPELIEVVETKATFSMSASIICPGQNVRFTNTSSNSTSYLWKFGDGTTSSSVSPQKNYAEAGSYQVWLFADNGVCKDSLMQTLVVEHVEAAFSLAEEFYCSLPAAISYQNNSVNGASFEWRFGSGGSSTAGSPLLTLPEEYPLKDRKATFSDTLIVTSPNGCMDTYVKENSVRIVLPKVVMTPSGSSPELSGCVPMQLTFSNLSSYDTDEDAIESFSWRVNSGAWQSLETLDVSVAEAAKVPVQLRVVTQKGCVHSNTEQINAGEKKVVDFKKLGNYERCASEMVMFEITSPAPEFRTREIWDFGDGSKPAFPVPFHEYEKIGKMNVSLTIYNNGCPSKVTKNNLVNMLGPYATIKVESSCDDPMLYSFEAEVMDATSYEWNFGDGTAAEAGKLKTQHRFTGPGNYLLTFKAVNSNTGCDYLITRELYVRQVKADFSISDETACLGAEITLDGSASVDNSPFSVNNQTVRYLWLFKEDAVSLGSLGNANHTMEVKGLNHISLVVQDANGCRDTLTKTVRVYKPAPEFESNYELGCMPVLFGFSDKSQSEAPIQSWLWNFGDGGSSTEQNPTHEYNQYGSFAVSLKLTDIHGCEGSLIKKNAVKAILPDASFIAENTKLCKDDIIKLSENSASEIVEYYWTISDGRTFREAEPRVSFPNPGYYSVSLKIKDVHGCVETADYNDFIHVQEPPVADFSADITEANCYPLVVQFKDLSVTDYPGSWTWSFGENENVSKVQDPFFIYNRPGYHDVTLISRTSYGCADTIVKPAYIHVGGPFAIIDVDEVVCRDVDVLFTAIEAQNVYDIRWSFGDGYSAEGSEASHRYSSSGSYEPLIFLRSDADNTCNKAIVGKVEVFDLQAAFSFGDDAGVGCQPFVPRLNNESLNATDYLWLQGDASGSVSGEFEPLFSYDNAGSYNLQLIANYSPLGCSDTTSATVVVNPLPTVTMHADTLICLGDAIKIWAEGGLSYVWSPAETLFEPNNNITLAAPDFTTSYQVQVTDHNGCVELGTMKLEVQQPPVVYLRDTTLIIGEELQFNLSDPEIGRFRWSPSDFISCTDCPDPLFKAMESMEYQVELTDVNNCFTLSYPFNLTVKKIYSLDIPTAFTPNGDGVNDKVFVKGWGIKELIYLKIFNRFGQMVYESSDLHQGWDGSFKGKPQPTETYLYIVQVLTEADELLQKTGSIKLLH